jgi:hypothetical protein
MALFYNAVKPLNIRPFYDANSIVDFTIKLRPGRAVKAGSLRVSGWLNVQKQKPNTTTYVPLVKDDCVYVDPFAGVHSFFRNSNCSVNDRTIESNSCYPRYASMTKQAKYTLEGLNTGSLATVELCGTQNNVLLMGSEIAPNTPVFSPPTTGSTYSIPFSFIPEVALNKCGQDLGQSRFPQMKLLFNLASPLECLYSTAKQTYITDEISNLRYQFLDLQLDWYETVEVPSSLPITFQTATLITQTLQSSANTFAVNSPTIYDAISLTFIKQDHRNKLAFNNLACEWVPGIENVGSSVEAQVSGNDQPIRFKIEQYSELALNYHRSLSGQVKNCLMNTWLSQNGCFGIGYKFTTAINDRLSINVILNGLTQEETPSASPSDCFIFVNGYLSV